MQLFSQYLAKGKDKCLAPFPHPFSLCTPQAGIFPAYILGETCFFDLVVHASVNIGTRSAKEKANTRTNRIYAAWTRIRLAGLSLPLAGNKYSNDKVQL